MTYAERVEMFSKDYLTIQDVQALIGITYQKASKLMCDIKRGLTLDPKFNGQGVRLDIQGKIHVQDYLDYFNLSADRYVVNIVKREEEKND